MLMLRGTRYSGIAGELGFDSTSVAGVKSAGIAAGDAGLAKVSISPTVTPSA
ncbi:MAG: hypothetical protein SFY80_16645 [Verrucomicrobiota bacterium]|nr:hypothetical protein [Verrucomicrobiota bacterium]